MKEVATEVAYDKAYYIARAKELKQNIDELTKRERVEIIKSLRHDVISSTSIDRARALNNEEGVNVIAETYWHQFVTFPFLAMHYAFDRNNEMYKKANNFGGMAKNGLKRLGWFAVSLLATATCILPVAGCVSHLTHKVLDHLHIKKSLKYKQMADKARVELDKASAEIERFEMEEKLARQEAKRAEKEAKKAGATKKVSTKKSISGYKQSGEDEAVR